MQSQLKNYHDRLHRNRIGILKFRWTPRRPQTAEETLSKNEECWRDHRSSLLLYYRAIVIQTACHRVRQVDEWDRQKRQWWECTLITVAKECYLRTSRTVGGHIKRTQRPLNYITYIINYMNYIGVLEEKGAFMGTIREVLKTGPKLKEEQCFRPKESYLWKHWG